MSKIACSFIVIFAVANYSASVFVAPLSARRPVAVFPVICVNSRLRQEYYHFVTQSVSLRKSLTVTSNLTL